MQTKSKLARSPDGNGGLYWALKHEGVLADLSGRDVRCCIERMVMIILSSLSCRYLHAYCVDNVLVRVADPVFMGYCIYKGAGTAEHCLVMTIHVSIDAGNKCVEKTCPDEAVGVVCKLEGMIQVVEYSEIDKETAELRDKEGKLSYSAGNICNHFFTTEFLKVGIYANFKE